MLRKIWLGCWYCILVSSLFLSPACKASGTDDYPMQRIRLVMGQSPGGAPDIVARILADRVGKTLGQPVVVEYKPSAGGIIAMDTIAKAPADGYTWLLATSQMMAITPYLGQKLPFDVSKDFVPVSLIGKSANILVAGPSLKVKSVAELIEYAKTHPTAVRYASAGIGSPAHLAGELLANLSGVKMLHVPYKSAGQALNDVVGGMVDFIITSPAAAKTYMDSGRLNVIASSGTEPDLLLPKLPLIKDTVPDYNVTQWWGIAMRSGTPNAITEKVHAAIEDALKDQQVRTLLSEQGISIQSMTMPEFSKFISQDQTQYQNLIKNTGIFK